jgi:signal transduction histidine kinase/ligand-binding sensor domain-containing protein
MYYWQRAVMRFGSLAIGVAVASILTAGQRATSGWTPETQDFYHTAWSESGIGAVKDIQQAPDGYLWLTTSKGIFRFDGVRFQSLDVVTAGAVRGADIDSVFLAPSGGMWLNPRSGGPLLWKDERLITYTDRRCTAALRAGGIVESRDGSRWIFASGGLFHMNGSSCEHIGAEHGFTDTYVEAILMDRRGTFWAKTDSGAIVFLPNGQSKFQSMPYKKTPVVGRVFMHDAPDGSIWLSDDLGLRRVTDREGNSIPPYPLNPSQDKSLRFGDFTFEHDGTLWAATTDGVERFDHVDRWKTPQADHGLASERFTRKQGLSSNAVWSLFVDREGTIWVGTNSGLDHLRRSALTTLTFPQSQEHEFSIAPGDRGSIWIGNEAMPLTHLAADGRATTFPQANMPITIRRDHNGAIWSAGEGRAHLLKVEGERISPVHYPGEEKALIVALGVDHNDELWISRIGPQIFHLSHGTWSEQNATLGRRPNLLGATAEDRDGNVWFAFANNVVKWDGQEFHRFSFPGPTVSVTSISVRGGHVWLGGTGGVQLLSEGRFHIMRWKDPELPGRVSGTVETPDGSLWINGFSGIAHVSPGELKKWIGNPDYAVSAENLNALDGLPGLSAERYPEPSMVEGSDGRLWFATTKGVAWMYPESLDRLRNKTPPPVAISSVVSNGKVYTNLDKLTLPPRVRNLEIDYTALSLAIPERVQFRYKLEGVDDDWQQPGTRRQAYYNDLAPRQYRFQVVASNNDGVWNVKGATLSFSVAPAWYQTRWFQAVYVGAFLALLWGLYRFRLAQIARQFSVRLEERVGERTRIARELHDTLLQSFQGSLFEFQAARNLLSRRPEEAGQGLDDAIRAAEAAITEGRDAIQGLRSGSVAHSDLSRLLTAAGQECASAEGSNGNSPAFCVTVEGPPQTLSPVLQDEIYRIGREVLRNAFRHAHAQRIEVEIRYDAQELRLRIRDDGIGIDREVLDAGARPGHWGLPGVRERAKLVGAKLDFWSEAGAGTELQLTVPASIAYLKSPTERVFGLFRKAEGSGEGRRVR